MSLSSRKRILMLLQNCAYPRDERVRREAKSLVAAGYRVTVICPAEHGQPWNETLNGVVVYRYPASPDAKGFLGYLWEYSYAMVVTFFLAVFILLVDGFDVIHAHHPPDTFGFIAAFFKLFGKRYVLDQHDIAPELYYARFKGKGNNLIYRMLIWMERYSCKIADHVIATNQSYKQIEMQRCGVPEQRISIVRNGPDLNELCSSNPDPILNKDGKTLIGYVGVMGTQDGVDYLLRALNRLKTDLSRKDYLCVLVGDGDALPGLKYLAQELGLDENIYFTGWVNSQMEVARFLTASDICVAPEPSNPYNDLSTAQKVMEYMAMGKPIVCFDLPEHRYSAQEAAVYAYPNDELDMACKISTLMDNPDLRKKMGDIGKDRILNGLGWQYQAKTLIQTYNENILQGHV